ncbi:alpha/beta hydrolase [Micromonospora sp. WMMD710]|nr:alpha/beta hydrolase [Micromonospora sp. WMMD710]MDG4758141.1 alpha/beta hydrolase [Micromonospora sp. WMMD710]
MTEFLVHSEHILQEKFHEVFAADVDAGTAELMAVTQRPASASTQEESVTKAAWKTIPSWALISAQDQGIPPDLQRFLAERAGSTTMEIAASHAVAVSQPGPVADFIDSAARATAPSMQMSKSRRG